jgi:hypothetical protein
MTRRGLTMAALFVAVSFLAGAQSNELIDRILTEDPLSYASAANLLLSAGEGSSAEIPAADAVARFEQKGWGMPGTPPAQPIDLGTWSFLMMRSLGIEGGIMYRILPSPRYAARELAYLGVVQGQAYPGMSISGERALRILELAINRREAAQ